MKVRALRELRFKTSKGEIVIKLGQIFKPADPGKLITAGFVEPVILPPDQVGKPIAAKIYSHILQDTVWVAIDPTFINDGDGIPVYSIEELRMMRVADEHTMRLLHGCKKEMSGILVAAKEKVRA